MKSRERKAEDGIFLLSCCMQEWVAVVPSPVFYTPTYLFCIFNFFCHVYSQNHGYVLKVGWKSHICVNSAHSRAHHSGKCRQAKPTFKCLHRLIPSFLSQSESIPHAKQLLLPSHGGIRKTGKLFLPAGAH